MELMLLLQAEQPFIWRFTPTECLVIVGILTIVTMILIFVAQQLLSRGKERKEISEIEKLKRENALKWDNINHQMATVMQENTELKQTLKHVLESGQEQIEVQEKEIATKVDEAKTSKEKTSLREEQLKLEQAESFMLAAWDELKKPDYKEALSNLQASIDYAITLPALCMLGFIYLELNDFDEALNKYNEAIYLRKQQGHSPDPMLLLYTGIVFRRWGLLHEANEKYIEAEKLWISANEQPHYLLYWCRGVVQTRLWNYDEAERLLLLAQEQRSKHSLPEHPELLVDLGLIAVEQYKYEQASIYFSKALELSNEQDEPSNIDYYVNLGRGLCLLDQYDEALDILDRGERILEEHKLPKNANLMMNRGFVYASQGKDDDAIHEYNIAKIYKDKHNLHCCVELAAMHGEVLRNKNHYKEANEKYCESEKLRLSERLPVDPKITFYKAMLHCDQRDLVTACQLACQARDMYAEHKLEAPVHPAILEFIEKHCTCQDEQAADSGPGQGPAPTDNAE